MKFAISNNERSRVQVPTAREATMNPSDDVEVAVNVTTPRYVPQGVTLRARVSDQLFTAVTKAYNLTNLEHDPRVRSVQVGRTLRIPDIVE